MRAAEGLDGGLQLPDEVEVCDPAPGKVGVSDRSPFPPERTAFRKVLEIQKGPSRHGCIILVRRVVRELAQIGRVVCIQDALERGRVAIRNRPATKSNGRDEQRSVEQASEYESVFEGDALIVESAMGKVAQELFIRPDLKIRVMYLSDAG